MPKRAAILQAALSRPSSKRSRLSRSCRSNHASTSSGTSSSNATNGTADASSDDTTTSTDTQEALAELANLILTQHKIVFITGAGMSVASGIKPFRGRDDAVWNQSIHEWGTREKFLQDPLIWYNHFWLKHFDDSENNQYAPNPGHMALARLARRYPDSVNVLTQNVDGLHSRGPMHIPTKQLIEVHGAGGSFKCVTDDCDYATSKLTSHPLNVTLPVADVDVTAKESTNKLNTAMDVAENVSTKQVNESADTSTTTKSNVNTSTNRVKVNDDDDNDNDVDIVSFATTTSTQQFRSRVEHYDHLPRCPDCNEVMAPNCLLFDEDYESHDSYQFDLATDWINNSDVIVFVGTSFNVKITDLALNAANKATTRGTASKVVFDVNVEDHVPASKTHRLVVRHATGQAELVLPALCDAVLAVAGPDRDQAADTALRLDG